MLNRARSNRGFTILEMLITVLILAIIAAAGGPTMASVVKNNRLRGEVDRVMLALNLARSEAVKRNAPVTICKSSNGASCTGNWEDGWIVFSNFDEDFSLDTGDGEALVQVFPGLPSGYTLNSDLSSGVVTYYADGSHSSNAGTIRVCPPDQDKDSAWTVAVNMVGRARASQGTSVCP